MPKRTRKLPPKSERREAARLGGSAVARAAFERPGGRHDRRKPNRRVEREASIRESRA